jgi:pimeloyl-[acyl-carrier protein] methyl ester esterase
LPGFDGTGDLFAPLVAALPRDYSPVVVSYREERVLDDYVESVATRLSGEDCVLIAESFSGPVALALLAKYPSKVRCAVLCTTFLTSPFHLLTRLARFVPTSLFGTQVGQRSLLRRFCLDDQCVPALMEQTLSVIRSVPAATIAHRLNVLATLNVAPKCSSITTPLLILRATHDRLVSRARYRQLIELLPRASVEDIDGPHLLLQAKPVECAQSIRRFIGKSFAAPFAFC